MRIKVTGENCFAFARVKTFEGELLVLETSSFKNFKVGEKVKCVFDASGKTVFLDIVNVLENFLYLYVPLTQSTENLQRRKFPRFEVQLNGFVNDYFNESMFGVPAEDPIFITDISLGGYGFKTETKIKVGNVCFLHFDLFDKTIAPKVAIRHSSKITDSGLNFYGCELLKVSPEDSRHIRRSMTRIHLEELSMKQKSNKLT